MSANKRNSRSIHDYIKKVYTLSSANFTSFVFFKYLFQINILMCEFFMAQKQT